MTEAELYEFLNDTVSVIMDAWTLFITVLFGYLVCAYTVGKRLSFLHSAALSIVYSIFSFMSAFSLYGAAKRISDVSERYPGYLQTREETHFLGALSVGIVLFIWLISVIYMISENRKKVRDAT